MFHGGGHCVGHPEYEVPLLRLLVTAYDIMCIAPSYRLAASTTLGTRSDGSRQSLPPDPRHLPFPTADPYLGFIVGGTSSGANLAASRAHRARDHHLRPPLASQFLSVVTVMHREHVPAKYLPDYLSWEQNKSAPILDRHLYSTFSNAFNPDPTSELWASFQVCGLDIFRDDGLIYGKGLREEAGVETRMVVYKGLPHPWWSMFPEMEASRRRVDDSVRAVGWLLGRMI
jgi:acetyl esterase/lipase